DSDVEPGEVEVDAVEVHAGSSAALAETGAGSPAFPASPAPAAPAGAGVGASPEVTAVFVVPGAQGPRATIREIPPDRSSRTLTFDGRPLTIGRAPENGLVVRDGRASRHHARIDVRRGSLVLTDLGSTNGSWVNDRKVESIALGEGDQVRIGMTTLIIEAVEPVARATRPHDAGAAPSQPVAAHDSGSAGAGEAAGSRSDRPAPA